MLRNIKEKDPEMLELMHRVTMELGKREREALKTIIRGMLK